MTIANWIFAKVCYFILFIGNFPAYVVDNWTCEDSFFLGIHCMHVKFQISKRLSTVKAGTSRYLNIASLNRHDTQYIFRVKMIYSHFSSGQPFLMNVWLLWIKTPTKQYNNQ